jgi:peroxiredoxin
MGPSAGRRKFGHWLYGAGTSKPAGAGSGVRGEARGEAPRELSSAARRSRREAAAEVRAGLLPGGTRVRGRAGAASLAFCALIACGAPSIPAAPPLWERPGLYGSIRPEMGPPQPGDRAPDFELPSSAGAFHLASLRGRWVLLHFTASWCPYCDAEVDHLGELARAYATRQVQVVLVGVNEEAGHWSRYAASRVAPSIVVLDDADGAVSRRYAPPHAQPSFEDRSQVMLDATVVVDPEGTIRLFLFPDSKHFDPTFRAVRGELDRWLAAPASRTQGAGVTLAPEQVVTIEAGAQRRVAAGETGDLMVILTIAPGYHVMSDHPSDPVFIPTRVSFRDADGLTWGEPRYPPPEPFRVAQDSIATFEGRTVVSLPFTMSKAAAPSRRTVEGTVRYQACTEGSCLFPVTRRITATIDAGAAQ